VCLSLWVLMCAAQADVDSLVKRLHSLKLRVTEQLTWQVELPHSRGDTLDTLVTQIQLLHALSFADTCTSSRAYVQLYGWDLASKDVQTALQGLPHWSGGIIFVFSSFDYEIHPRSAHIRSTQMRTSSWLHTSPPHTGCGC
jgi:hypothetical protein